MVSKESFKKAMKERDVWIKENPNPGFKKVIKKVIKETEKVLELEFGLHTLPSLLVPMPEESVKDLKKNINKLRGKRE